MASAEMRKPKSIFENVRDLAGLSDHPPSPTNSSSGGLDLSSKMKTPVVHHPRPLMGSVAPQGFLMDQFNLLLAAAAHGPRELSVFAQMGWPTSALCPQYSPPASLVPNTAEIMMLAPSQLTAHPAATKTDAEKPNLAQTSAKQVVSASRSSPLQLQLPAHPPSTLSLLPSGSKASTSARQAPRFQCPDCNRSYSTFSGLSKHRQFHCTSQLKRQFACKFCDKQYSSLGALKMHIRTHTLPCKCQMCGKAFSRPWLLQGHLRTHTGEKPFRCGHCGRAFADRSNLRAHLQTHSDIKKYRCKSCQKTFSRMSLLSKHENNGCPGLLL